jgi:hypothetical protein
MKVYIFRQATSHELVLFSLTAMLDKRPRAAAVMAGIRSSRRRVTSASQGRQTRYSQSAICSIEACFTSQSCNKVSEVARDYS